MLWAVFFATHTGKREGSGVMDKKVKGGGQRKEQIQMSAGRQTAMAGKEAPEKEWACLGKIG